MNVDKGQITQEIKVQELPFLIITHHLTMLGVCVKIHSHIL